MLKKISILFYLVPVLLSANYGAGERVASQRDNTRVNQRDQRSTNLTAQDQSRGSASDVEMTRKIRSTLTDDDSLSTNAKNVKIVTLNGRVTLRGPVEDASEKATVERLARQVATDAEIDNELEVTSPSSTY